MIREDVRARFPLAEVVSERNFWRRRGCGDPQLFKSLQSKNDSQWVTAMILSSAVGKANGLVSSIGISTSN